MRSNRYGVFEERAKVCFGRCKPNRATLSRITRYTGSLDCGPPRFHRSRPGLLREFGECTSYQDAIELRVDAHALARLLEEMGPRVNREPRTIAEVVDNLPAAVLSFPNCTFDPLGAQQWELRETSTPSLALVKAATPAMTRSPRSVDDRLKKTDSLITRCYVEENASN